MFEKVIYKRPYHHLTSNNILIKEQFGFRCNNSTNIAIYTLINPLNAELNPMCHLLALLGAHHILHVSKIRVNKVLSSLNNKIIVSGLFCDLQKAFNCINYDIII
jgi:hypothetical protein